MSKTISFKCDESSTQLFIRILCKLALAGGGNRTRKIRIGGDEYTFIGGCDTVSEISIDGKLLSDHSPSEIRDFQTLRDAIVSPAPITTQQQSITVAASTDTAPVVMPPVSSDDDDDDLLRSPEAIAALDSVTAKVNQGQLFTAFDITKELRQRGSQVQHRNIKQIVHALYNHGDMQGYNRSLIDVDGAPVRPFLYHPASSDPSTYQP